MLRKPTTRGPRDPTAAGALIVIDRRAVAVAAWRLEHTELDASLLYDGCPNDGRWWLSPAHALTDGSCE